MHCVPLDIVTKFLLEKVEKKAKDFHHSTTLNFKGLIEREFVRMFRDLNKGGSRLFIQDGDPGQNSALACATWTRILLV